jgi:hypothetical protein
MTCYTPPEAPLPGEYIQSTVTEPEANVLSARRESDGSWTVLLTSKNGVVNRLRLPSECESRGGCKK